jgi:hypothetical protein
MYDVETVAVHFLLPLNPRFDICFVQRAADKQTADGERPKIAVIKSGDADIDNHCAPSTLTGDVADGIDAYRQQQLRVFTEACQLCRQGGVVLSERLLRSG